jgi:MFS family permease
MSLFRLTSSVSKNNFYAFLWHGVFLALAQNFMDVDTIVPSMIIDAGGNSFHIGLLTAIILGGSSFMQLVFSPYLNNKKEKKNYLISAILIRVAALLGLGILLYFTSKNSSFSSPLTLIFGLIILFSLSGAFAAISYTDILGKSMLPEKRKSFFSIRQAVMGIGVFISALLAAKMLVGFDYPINYSTLFITAGIALGIASLGFLKIKEVGVTVHKIEGVKNYIQTLRSEIKSNSRLKGYLLVVNTLGVSLSLLPFLMLYSKQFFNTGNSDVGHYLIFKVSAGVIAGLSIYFFAHKVKYKKLLMSIAFLAILIPIHLLYFQWQPAFIIYFFAGGLIYTFYKIAIEGILLEVSSNENRAIYAGISGAGSIIPIIFPIVGGWIIGSFGFTWFFALFLLIITLSMYFIWQLDCKK